MRIARSAVCGRFEIPVAKTSASASEQLYFLSVVGHLAEEFAVLSVVNRRSARHFYNLVLSVLSKAAAFSARLSVGGENVPLIFQVEQRPQVAVATQNDMSATSAVSTVGAAFRHVFGAMEMA